MTSLNFLLEGGPPIPHYLGRVVTIGKMDPSDETDTALGYLGKVGKIVAIGTLIESRTEWAELNFPENIGKQPKIGDGHRFRTERLT